MLILILNLNKFVAVTLIIILLIITTTTILITIPDIRGNISNYCDGEGSDIVKAFIYKCSMKII
jgi:hypothetical protein